MNSLGPLCAYSGSILYCKLNEIDFFKNKNDLFHKSLITLQNFMLGTLWYLYIIPNYQHLSLLDEIKAIAYHSLIAEFCFYWIHRLLHTPRFYWIHKLHHYEKHPNPIDSYVMSVQEAILIILVLSVPDVLQIPITVRGTILYKGISLFISILHHGGWGGYHARHHKYIKGNYGGTYNLYDYIFGTVM